MTKGAPRSHPLPATSAPAALAAELPPIGSVDLADAAANRPVPAANRQAAEWPSPGRAPLLAVLGDEPADTIAGLNQRNAPCRRHAFEFIFFLDLRFCYRQFFALRQTPRQVLSMGP
jgi:hypothetical protein